MKAVMKKVGEVALSLLLVGLICIPVPAMSALAEESDANSTEQSEQAQQQAADSQDDLEADEDSEEVDSNESDVDSADDVDADESDVTDGKDEAADDVDGAKVMMLSAEPDAAVQAAEAPAEATSTDSFTVTTADELTAAISAIGADAAAGPFTITLAGDIDLSDSVSIPSGKTVTIEGDGHTIALEGSASLGVEAANTTLNLNGGLTIEAGNGHAGTLVVVQHGTLNMSSGVTIEGNGNDSAIYGGGVSVTDKGTFNMNGGTIENCSAHTGGGVYACAATFNMSGNSVIQNCKADVSGTLINGDGGGVFLNVDRRAGATTMIMSGNATIRNNSANSLGGGVFAETATTFTMEGNASVVQNSADAGGGVMNYGMATLTTVYNNSSNNGAADIFNNGRMKLSPTNPDWVLLSTGTHVTGWYVDTYRSWDGTDPEEGGEHRWTPDVDGDVEYIPTDDVTSEQLTLIAGAPLPTVNVIWENEDGTVLYQMDDVQQDKVPAATEYKTLSGHDDPTEPNTAEGYVHDFAGWTETHPSDDEVLYIANYNLVAPHANAHTLTVHYVDENGNQMAPDFTEAVEAGDGYVVPSPHIDGYEPDMAEVTGTAADADIETTVVYHAAEGTPSIQEGTTEGMSGYGSLSQTGDDSGYALAGLMAVASVSALAVGASLVLRKRQGQEQ